MIDPGHNGRNGSHGSEISRQVDAGGLRKACNTTGTAAGDYSEATFNWEVAQRLRDELQSLGANVVLTRQDNDGWGPCVDQRGRTAQEAGADALVSIHADGNNSASARGFHIIHPGKVSGYTDDTVEPSKILATLIRDGLVTEGLTPSTYIGGSSGLNQRTDIGTINMSGVPAVMLESGNMRNAQDVALLRSEAGQQQIAAGVAAGLTKYFG